MRSGRKLSGTWDEDLEQDPEAYFEVISVEDVPPLPGWSFATYYKKVTGKINCKIKNLNAEEAPIEVDLRFSTYMVY